MDQLARPAHPKRLVVQLLKGPTGLVAGWLGALGLSVVTVVDRQLELPLLYEHPQDLLQHGIVEAFAGCALWTLAWSLLWVLLAAGRLLPSAGWARRMVSTGALLLFGVSFGVLNCFLVVRYSAVWLLMPPAFWWGGWSLLGIALLALGYRLLVRPVTPGPPKLGLVVLGIGGAVHEWSLHHSLERYGNLHALAQLLSLALVGLGCALVVPQWRGWSRATLVAGLLFLVTLPVALGTPSLSLRRAVLVFGGIAKPVLLQVVWPLADRDGDGVPSSFWGVDPDDHDARVTALSGIAGAPPRVREPLGISLKHGPRLNLLWVVIDTARADSLERLIAEDPLVEQGFASFAFYANYSSCSTRTSLVMSQLLDTPRCDQRELAGLGEQSLLQILRSQGYRDELLFYYSTPPHFQQRRQVTNDPKLLELARSSLARPSSAPRALFVHLKGGHGDYQAPGSSPRERYENQLKTSFEAVAALVRSLPRDSWVVVVHGDHGEAFGEHSSYAHATTLYEEVLRTPLLVRAPSIQAGRRPEALGCPDVAWKTLFAVGVLEREPSALDYQYATLDLPHGRTRQNSLRSLRRGSKKVVWSPQLGIWEEYDLNHDPLELHSLAESRSLEFAPLRSELERLSRVCPTPDLPVVSQSGSSY